MLFFIGINLCVRNRFEKICPNISIFLFCLIQKSVNNHIQRHLWWRFNCNLHSDLHSNLQCPFSMFYLYCRCSQNMSFPHAYIWTHVHTHTCIQHVHAHTYRTQSHSFYIPYTPHTTGMQTTFPVVMTATNETLVLKWAGWAWLLISHVQLILHAVSWPAWKTRIQ